MFYRPLKLFKCVVKNPEVGLTDGFVLAVSILISQFTINGDKILTNIVPHHYISFRVLGSSTVLQTVLTTLQYIYKMRSLAYSYNYNNSIKEENLFIEESTKFSARFLNEIIKPIKY